MLALQRLTGNAGSDTIRARKGRWTDLVDRERDHREIYITTIFETVTDATGTPFVVVVDRRIQLTFWTAFAPTPNYLSKIRAGKLIWQPQSG